MKKFDKHIVEAYILQLCKKHKIIIVKWSTTSCGEAWYKSRTIKIPKPTNIDRFCIALHEIGHIVNGVGKKQNYIEEYDAEVFALKHCLLAGFHFGDYIKRAKAYVLLNLAKAHNRGLNHNTIPQNVRAFVSEWNLQTWIGCKVFVSGWGTAVYKGKPITVELQPRSDFKDFFNGWTDVIKNL